MAAANSLARLEHEAGFPGEIFHEGSANWKITCTFVLQKPQARTQSYFQQAETRMAILIRRTRGKCGCHVAAPLIQHQCIGQTSCSYEHYLVDQKIFLGCIHMSPALYRFPYTSFGKHEFACISMAAVHIDTSTGYL